MAQDNIHRAQSGTAVGAFELMVIAGSGIHPRLLAHAHARGREHAGTSSTATTPAMADRVVSLRRY